MNSKESQMSMSLEKIKSFTQPLNPSRKTSGQATTNHHV